VDSPLLSRTNVRLDAAAKKRPGCYVRFPALWAGHQADELSSTLFEASCQPQRHLSVNSRHQRQRIARDLCRYRQRFEATCFVPDAQRVPARQPHAIPVLFGPEAVTRLLAAASTLKPHPCAPLRAEVMRLAIVLLYTAGLRRRELVRLTLSDVDSQTGVLRIRASKFYKSRLVPLSAVACDELNRYLEQRLSLTPHPSPDAPMLGHQRRGGGLRTYTGLFEQPARLFEQAEVRDADGRIRRVHDFRHVFAIEALLHLISRRRRCASAAAQARPLHGPRLDRFHPVLPTLCPFARRSRQRPL
jgi:integrase/recombinase XerD